jgi:hypothetical protein
MAFGSTRQTVRVSSRRKSLSDLYDGARKEESTDQPIDRIRQEVFVEMARHGRAVERQQMRQGLLDALWVVAALAVVLGVSAYYLDIMIGALLPLARPLARTDTVEGERARGRRASDPTRMRMPMLPEPARASPTLVDPGGAAVRSETAPGASAARPADTGIRHRDEIAGAIGERETGGVGEVAQELQERLQSWIATLNARDVARLKSFYAPMMSAFYRARNVSREFALADKVDQFRRAEVLSVRADAADIALRPDGRSAALTFRKRYEITGGGLHRVGEVVSEFCWARSPGHTPSVIRADRRSTQGRPLAAPPGWPAVKRCGQPRIEGRRRGGRRRAGRTRAGALAPR